MGIISGLFLPPRQHLGKKTRHPVIEVPGFDLYGEQVNSPDDLTLFLQCIRRRTMTTAIEETTNASESPPVGDMPAAAAR